jgi:hypothetical protein
LLSFSRRHFDAPTMRAIASSPEAAVSTRNPSLSSIVRVTVRTMVSSSTTRMTDSGACTRSSFDAACSAAMADHLRWLSIDHRAGFTLSSVDGSSSVEMILRDAQARRAPHLARAGRPDDRRVSLERARSRFLALTHKRRSAS